MNIYPQILLINDVCHFIVVLSCCCCCMQLSLKTCTEEKNKTVITNSRGHLCNYQPSHNLGKFPQIFAVSLGVVLGIMRILCIPFKILLLG